MGHTLLEFARVGKVAGYEVSIYSGEGPIPYFHFYDKERNRKGCIRIDSPEYFNHGDNNYTLNTKEIKNLISWLNSKHKILNISMWDYMKVLWDDNNPDYILFADLDMPDYNLLKNYK